jgi:hypothetical protein
VPSPEKQVYPIRRSQVDKPARPGYELTVRSVMFVYHREKPLKILSSRWMIIICSRYQIINDIALRPTLSAAFPDRP